MENHQLFQVNSEKQLIVFMYEERNPHSADKYMYATTLPSMLMVTQHQSMKVILSAKHRHRHCMDTVSKFSQQGSKPITINPLSWY